MKLSDHDLTQLNEKDLLELPEESLRHLSVKLLNDLKEARERLRQNSRNSSRPPSSDAPWTDNKTEPEDKDLSDNTEATEEKSTPKDEKINPQKNSAPIKKNKNKGKQPGAQGFGRTQTLELTSVEPHYPQTCSRCENPLDKETAVAYTAFETIDCEWANPKAPGLRLTNTKNIYYEITCACGHCTRHAPRCELVDGTAVEISEWRLVGAGLATLIVCLALRMRLSRARIQEFLWDWLGLHLCVGTLNATIHEAGACALPIQEELLAAIVASDLVHVDETSWPESKTLLWLWVFCSQQFVVYWIAHRTTELVDNVLNDYQGWLMTDGYGVYRHFHKRLRCWAHLDRKAKGLMECLDKEASVFGKHTQELLHLLMNAVYDARERPPDIPLPIVYQELLACFRLECELMRLSPHEKARALATEMLNDWDAIFQVLLYPHLPLTNNEAERALRHWVILRRISHGTRSEDGSRLFAILISVIETRRIQNLSPWTYLHSVIRQRRLGLPAPKVFGQGE